MDDENQPIGNDNDLANLEEAADAFQLDANHELFERLQKKLKDNTLADMQKAQDSLKELLKMKQLLTGDQEQAGVDMHYFQKQLAENQTKIEGLERQHAETLAARKEIEEQQRQVVQELNENDAAVKKLQLEEQQIREQNQIAAQQLIQMASQNEELKSDAMVRKRTVYRTEEQIKDEENQKLRQEQLIEIQQNVLKQQQDQEVFLLKQLQIQQQETNQAQAILDEAIAQMQAIKDEITETRRKWSLSLKQIELKTEHLKSHLQEEINELNSTKISLLAGIKSGKQERENLIRSTAQKIEETRIQQAKKQHLSEVKENLRVEVIGGLQQQYQQLEASCQDKTIGLDQIQLELQKETKNIEEISKQNDKAQRLLNQLENDILIKNAEQMANNRQLQGLKTEMENVKQDILNTQRDIEKQENEISRRKFDAIQSQGVVDSLQNAQEALIKEVDEKDKLITSYEQQIKKNANAIEQRSSAITRLNKKLEEHLKAHPDTDNGPLQAELNNLGKELSQAGRMVKEVQTMWLRSQTELVMLSQQLQEQMEEIRDKEEQRQLLERKLKDLDFENQTNTLKIASIQRDIEFMHKDITSLSSKTADIELKITLLNAQNYDAEALTQQSLGEKTADIQRMQQQILHYQEEKREISAVLVEVEEQVLLVQRKIAIQHQLMTSIKENCSLANGGEIAELEQQIHNYEVQISTLKKQQRELLNQLERGVEMRVVHQNAVRALQAVQKPGATQTGAVVSQELDTVKYKIGQSGNKLEAAKNQFNEKQHRLKEAEEEGEELQAIVEQFRAKLQ